mgnify:CR=1 FL=1
MMSSMRKEDPVVGRSGGMTMALLSIVLIGVNWGAYGMFKSRQSALDDCPIGEPPLVDASWLAHGKDVIGSQVDMHLASGILSIILTVVWMAKSTLPNIPLSLLILLNMALIISEFISIGAYPGFDNVLQNTKACGGDGSTKRSSYLTLDIIAVIITNALVIFGHLLLPRNKK